MYPRIIKAPMQSSYIVLVVMIGNKLLNIKRQPHALCYPRGNVIRFTFLSQGAQKRLQRVPRGCFMGRNLLVQSGKCMHQFEQPPHAMVVQRERGCSPITFRQKCTLKPALLGYVTVTRTHSETAKSHPHRPQLPVVVACESPCLPLLGSECLDAQRWATAFPIRSEILFFSGTLFLGLLPRNNSHAAQVSRS